jgi:polyhydroxyalkanoate synthase
MDDDKSSQNPWLRLYESMLDEGMRNFRRATRLPFVYQQAQEVRKGASSSKVVYEEDRLKLLRYDREEEPRFATPLVVVFGLVNRPYILDLKPGRSVVEHFVKYGFDTYLVDWGIPTYADRHLTFDDYINGYELNVVDYVRERTGCEQVNMLAYCMGGTMSAMFTALHPDRIKNLILLAAAIDFGSRDGMLSLWTDEKYFDVDKLIDAYGNCPAELLQASFQLIKPVSNLVGKHIAFIERLDDEAYLDDFFTMETWLNDNIPVPGEVFRQFVKDLYQRNLLAKNELRVGRRVVNLKRIACPVLNLMAAGDDLVPCAQSEPFNDLVGSADRKAMKIPAGHIGLAVGSRAHRELWPQACRWLAERS